MPTTAEKLQAFVQQEKQKRRDEEELKERAREGRRQAAEAMRAAEAAQAAIAAAAELRASTYKMPPEGGAPQRTHTKRSQKAATERHLARKAMAKPSSTKDLQSLVQLYHGSGSSVTADDGAAVAAVPLDDAAAGPPVAVESAIFVHFIPPPLRHPDRKTLPWIVHTCNGTGCHEARHVSFHTISGFSTYEGVPPEQVSGSACSCTIANHHLRGYGRVRWDGDHAIVEDDDRADERVTMVNPRAYLAKANRLSDELAQAKERIKAMRATEDDLRQRLQASMVSAASTTPTKPASVRMPLLSLEAELPNAAEGVIAAEEATGAATTEPCDPDPDLCA